MVNPSKTILNNFTRQRKAIMARIPSLFGEALEFKDEVKYPGVTLDRKLTWNSHLRIITNKAKAALMTTQRMVGVKWGLKPSVMHWLYLRVVRPMVTYGSLVWWPKTLQAQAKAQLNSVAY